MSGKRGRPATGQQFTDEILLPRGLRDMIASEIERSGLNYQKFLRGVIAEGLRALGMLTDEIKSLGMEQLSLSSLKPSASQRGATMKDLEDLMREVRFMIQESNVNWGDVLGDSYRILAYPDTIEEGDLLTAGGPGCGDWVVAWPEIIGKPIGEFTKGKACRCVARLKPPYSADNLPLSPPGLPNGWFYMGGDDVITEDDMITVSGWDAPDYKWGRAGKDTIGYRRTLRELRERHKDAFAARSFETSLPSDGTSQQEAAGGVFEL